MLALTSRGSLEFVDRDAKQNQPEDFMRKSFVRVVGALAVAAALTSAGCGRSTTTEATGGGDRTGTVGIAMPTKSSERWVADGNNMAEQFKKLGYQTDLQYGDDVVQNQVSQIENMITKGVKALVIAPIDSSSLTDILQRAADAKIPVVSYDRLIRGTAERGLLRDVRQLQGRCAAGDLHRRQARASHRARAPSTSSCSPDRPTTTTRRSSSTAR